MAKTLQKLSADEMQELAEKLIGMKVNKARGYTRRLDPESQLQMYRQDVHSEILTRINLPNLGVSVTLVEEPNSAPTGKGDKLKAEPRYVEARVVALD